MLFDSKWNLEETINIEIEPNTDKSLISFNITSDGSLIYILDVLKNQIDIFDYDFNFVHDYKPRSSLDNEIIMLGIDYRNETLYVLGTNIIRDLHYLIVIDREAWSSNVTYNVIESCNIKVISENRLFLNSDSSLYLYKMPNCEKSKVTYNHSIGKVSEINDYFYEISSNFVLRCYNSFGEVVNMIDVHKIWRRLKGENITYLTRVKDDLFMFTDGKKCIKLKI